MGRYVEPLSYRISAYLRAGETKKALQIVEKASGNEQWVRRVIREMESDWRTFSSGDDAIWFFSELLKICRDSNIKQRALDQLIIYRNKKALDFIYQNKLDEANKVLEESIQKKAVDGYTWLFYALSMRKSGFLHESDEFIQKYLDFNPVNDYDGFAFFLNAAGMVAEAEVYYKRSLDNPRNALNTFKSYLWFLRQHKKYDEMLEYCKKIDDIEPNDPRTFHDRAYAFKGLGRFKEAIDQLWGCITHVHVLSKDVKVEIQDLNSTITYRGRESYQRVIAREICNLVTFQINSTSTEEIERVKKFFPKDYNWTMFYNGCIWYIQARNHWYNRDWEEANNAFSKAETRFDMSDELAAMGHTIIVWRLFSTDWELNQLFSEFDLLDRHEILERIEHLAKEAKRDRVERQDDFGKMINGYVDSLEYLNYLLNFFRGMAISIDKQVFATIRMAFASTDFTAGFDTLDALRKIEICIARCSAQKLPEALDEKESIYTKCWIEIEKYLTSAITTMNGPSMYQMVRSSDRIVNVEQPDNKVSPEPSLVFNSATEGDLIDRWRKFRDFENISKKAKQDYQSLVKATTNLWSECNEVAKQKNWQGIGYVFKPTTRIIGIPLSLNDTVARSRQDFGNFIQLIFFWVYEASSNGSRFPSNVEIQHYINIITELRHHFEHDREHGKSADVRRKYMVIAKIFEELTGKQPYKEFDWWLLQLAVLLRINAILSLTLDNLTFNSANGR